MGALDASDEGALPSTQTNPFCGTLSSMPTYSDNEIIEAVAASITVADAMRKLNMEVAGGSHTNLTRRIKKLGIDTSHFVKGVRLKHPPIKVTSATIFVVRPEGSARTSGSVLRKMLIKIGRPFVCVGEGCPLEGSTWAGKPLMLQVDHIDGNKLNNLENNLRFLCPNCHTQTETYGWRTKRIKRFCECGREIKTLKAEHCQSCANRRNASGNGRDLEAKNRKQKERTDTRRKEFMEGKFCIDCGSKDRLELTSNNPSITLPKGIWSSSDSRRKDILVGVEIRCKPCQAIRVAPMGENHRNFKLTDEQVIEIRRLYQGGEKIVNLATKFGVVKQTIDGIVKGRDRKNLLPT